ncbi:hypothetical protein [Actinoplanes sp. NPDC023714]|uniref:hypothetical protein n=1 Tax=Actinoplanes sp. NPDC023714 TaxID=3154322 RepID=UPI0033F1316F
MGVEESRDDRIVAEFGDGHDVDGIAARYGITVAEVYAVVEREVGPSVPAPPGPYPVPGHYPPPAYAPPAHSAPPSAYAPPGYAPPGYAVPQAYQAPQPGTTLATTLTEWTDSDGAQFLLGQAIGVFGGRPFAEVRHVFWAGDPLGHELRGMLLALVRTGVLEWRGHPAEQFRWRRG